MKAPIARLGYVLVFLVVAGYALIALSGPKGLRALSQKQAQIRQMEKRNEEMARENERLRDHIQRLGNNPTEQELELRDRYKLANPKDKVYIIGKPDKK